MTDEEVLDQKKTYVDAVYIRAILPTIDGLENALSNAVKPVYDAEKAEWVLYCGGEKSANAILTAARRYFEVTKGDEDTPEKCVNCGEELCAEQCPNPKCYMNEEGKEND